MMDMQLVSRKHCVTDNSLCMPKGFNISTLSYVFDTVDISIHVCLSLTRVCCISVHVALYFFFFSDARYTVHSYMKWIRFTIYESYSIYESR